MLASNPDINVSVFFELTKIKQICFNVKSFKHVYVFILKPTNLILNKLINIKKIRIFVHFFIEIFKQLKLFKQTTSCSLK